MDHYNNVRLNSATDYITPKDMLAGRQQEIHAERDRKSYKRGCQETFLPASKAAGILSGIQPPARSTALRLIVVGPPHQQRDIGLQSAVASCS